MRLISLYFIIVFSALFTSCKYQEVEVGEIEGIKIVEVNKQFVSLELLIPIKNDNNFKFKVKKVDLDINMNGNELGKVREMKNIVVKANSNETHSLLVKIEFSKVLKNSVNLLSSIIMKKNAKLKLKGYIRVKAFFIGKTIEIDVDKPVKLFNTENFKNIFQ